MPPRSHKRGPKEHPLLTQAAADGAATLFFVLAMSPVGQLSSWLAPVLGLSPSGTGLALVVGLLLLMLPVCAGLGNALFNPANNALLYATGKGELVAHVVRAVAQCVGAVLGVGLAQMLLPFTWQKGFPSMALGVRGDVDIFEGATCEFVLGMLLAFLVLYSQDLKSRFWKLWLPLIATVLAVRAGEPYSGPSLNPAITFGWELWYQQQSRAEHAFVFWVAPLAAGLMGGWCYLGMREFVARKQQQQRRQSNKAAKEE